jgi:hypothetical protein
MLVCEVDAPEIENFGYEWCRRRASKCSVVEQTAVVWRGGAVVWQVCLLDHMCFYVSMKSGPSILDSFYF